MKTYQDPAEISPPHKAAREYHELIGAGLSLGNAVVQLILAMLTAFFLYRDDVAVRRSLVTVVS